MDYENLRDGKKTSMNELLTKWVPRISLIVGLCTFIFQVVVLYPWHLELSAEFAKLAAAVKNATK